MKKLVLMAVAIVAVSFASCGNKAANAEQATADSIQIADELAKLGHNIDRKIIVVKDAVKEVGNYKAIVKLHKEVSVEIPFEVVAEEA